MASVWWHAHAKLHLARSIQCTSEQQRENGTQLVQAQSDGQRVVARTRKAASGQKYTVHLRAAM